MSFTVVPLHNFWLPAGSRVDFGAGLVLTEIPTWLKDDPELNELSSHDRRSAQKAKFALVAEYSADSIGTRDPEWGGESPKAIQNMKTEAAIFANLALWLTQPSTACFTFSFHALSWPEDAAKNIKPSIRWTQEEPPLRIHPNDMGKRIFLEQVLEAAKLHVTLTSIPRKNRIWTALRAIWAGLATYQRDIRYSLFWIGLEALFGSDGSTEISYKLAQRIAFFTCDTPETATLAFQKVKRCYGTRSRIVHGTWEDDATFDEHMGDTEDFARKLCLRLLNDKQLIATFLHKKGREKFLEEFVFSHAGAFDHTGAPEPED